MFSQSLTCVGLGVPREDPDQRQHDINFFDLCRQVWHVHDMMGQSVLCSTVLAVLLGKESRQFRLGQINLHSIALPAMSS